MSFTLWYQHKVKIHFPSLCVIRYSFILSQRPMTTGQRSMLIFLPTFVLVCICKHWLFTMWKPHVWICVLAQFWPFVSNAFELLIDYLSDLYFDDEVCKGFLQKLWVSVCFFFSWALLAVLCCVVGDTRERSVTPLLFQSEKSVLILSMNLNFTGLEIYERRGEIKFGPVTLRSCVTV